MSGSPEEVIWRIEEESVFRLSDHNYIIIIYLERQRITLTSVQTTTNIWHTIVLLSFVAGKLTGKRWGRRRGWQIWSFKRRDLATGSSGFGGRKLHVAE